MTPAHGFRPHSGPYELLAPMEDVERPAAPALDQAGPIEDARNDRVSRPGLVWLRQPLRRDPEVQRGGIGEL